MALAVLAAAVVAAAPAALPANPLAPIGLDARFVERPSVNEYNLDYPHGPANMGMPGHVSLDCGVQADGRLEACKVAHEIPQGMGFGGAALDLARAFRLEDKSASAAGGEFHLLVGFARAVSDDSRLSIGPWLAAPTFADTSAVYPDIGGGVTGQVFLHCGLRRDGRLADCRALFQRPVDRDFDQAALKLVPLFRMKIDPGLLKSGEPLAADVLVRIAAPFEADARERRMADPVWLSAPTSAALSALFPAEARAKGVTAGTGAVDCTVTPDGSLADCQADGQGDPAGLGFSQAALKAAAQMRMSPWTHDGGPVDGARVRLPFRFRLAAQ